MTMSLPIDIAANSTSATTAKMTPGLENRSRTAVGEGDAGQHHAERGGCGAERPGSASAISPRTSTARTTVNPPYAATTPLTTAIGPMRRPVK